jgi:hypothetical protein
MSRSFGVVGPDPTFIMAFMERSRSREGAYKGTEQFHILIPHIFFFGIPCRETLAMVKTVPLSENQATSDTFVSGGWSGLFRSSTDRRRELPEAGVPADILTY